MLGLIAIITAQLLLAPPPVHQSQRLPVLSETPTHWTFPISPLHQKHPAPPPVDVLAMALQQDGAPIDGTIQEGVPLEFALHIRPTGVLPNESEVLIRIQGTGPAFEHAIPLDSVQAPVGTFVTLRGQMALWRVRYNGRAVFNLIYRANTEAPDETLYAKPVMVSPTWKESPLTLDEIREAAPGVDTALGAWFRLGPGATLDVPVPEDRKHPMEALTVVSKTMYDPEVRQGETVIRIDLLDAESVVDTLELQAGVTTAKSDIDEYPDTMMHSQKIDIFSSQEAGYNNRFTGEPFEMHTYIATIPLDTPVPFDKIRFTYARGYGLAEIANVGFHMSSGD